MTYITRKREGECEEKSIRRRKSLAARIIASLLISFSTKARTMIYTDGVRSAFMYIDIRSDSPQKKYFHCDKPPLLIFFLFLLLRK